MKIRIDEKGDSRIAIVSSDDLILKNIQDALDIMATVQYYGCDKVVIHKKSIIQDFFYLRTRLAGDILQKYVNYDVKIAIVGEFDSFNSKSLSDFIYECNSGKNVFFKDTIEEAVESLHRV